MTNITKAAQQAIDALEQALPELCIEHMSDAKGAIKALRAALQDKAGEAVVSLTGPERVWTCTVIGRAEDLPHGADAPMRQAVYQAFAKATGDAPAHIFSGWGAPVPERYRAVIDNRPPDPEVIRKECVGILDTLPAAQPAPVVPDDVALLDWLKDNLFTHRWNGVVGPGCAVRWHVAPDFRHKQVGLIDSSGPGGDFRAAIRAAMLASQQKGGGDVG